MAVVVKSIKREGIREIGIGRFVNLENKIFVIFYLLI
jgi:hypothetical protein